MLDSPVRDEEAINQNTITTLAQEMHCPLPVVKQVYEAEFARLKADARITDYLVLFAARRTRDALARHF
jgi:vancomycin permeability regulator SanA